MDVREFINHSLRGGGIVALSVVFQFAVGFIVQAALARELDPSLFGQIAFAAAIGMSLNSFTNSNGDRYVIQHKGNPQKILDNVFTLELVLASCFLLLMLFVAPMIMTACGKGESALYAQVLAFAYFYNPLIRPRCLFERDLAFFRARFPLIGAQILGAVATLALAHHGYGIWALIFWRLSVPFSEALVIWSITPYRPRFAWDLFIIKDVFHFGLPLMLAGFLAFFALNIPYYIFDRVFEDSDTQKGYYWLAFQFSTYFLKTRVIIYNVLFPLFSNFVDGDRKARLFTKITKAVTGVFLIPTLISIFFGRDIILLVFGSKWEPSVFPFQIVFIAILIRAINSNAGYFLHSSGITKVALVGPCIQLLILLPLGYVLTQKYGIAGMAFSVLIADIAVIVVIYEFFIKTLTNKGVLYFFAVPLFLSGLAFSLMYWVSTNNLDLEWRLLVFGALLLAAYWLALREPMGDIFSGAKIIRDREKSE